jgi:hypothetical protein
MFVDFGELCQFRHRAHFDSVCFDVIVVMSVAIIIVVVMFVDIVDFVVIAKRHVLGNINIVIIVGDDVVIAVVISSSAIDATVSNQPNTKLHPFFSMNILEIQNEKKKTVTHKPGASQSRQWQRKTRSSHANQHR